MVQVVSARRFVRVGEYVLQVCGARQICQTSCGCEQLDAACFRSPCSSKFELRIEEWLLDARTCAGVGLNRSPSSGSFDEWALSCAKVCCALSVIRRAVRLQWTELRTLRSHGLTCELAGPVHWSVASPAHVVLDSVVCRGPGTILDLLHFLRELGIASSFAMRFLRPGVQGSGFGRAVWNAVPLHFKCGSRSHVTRLTRRNGHLVASKKLDLRFSSLVGRTHCHPLFGPSCNSCFKVTTVHQKLRFLLGWICPWRLMCCSLQKCHFALAQGCRFGEAGCSRVTPVQ